MSTRFHESSSSDEHPATLDDRTKRGDETWTVCVFSSHKPNVHISKQALYRGKTTLIISKSYTHATCKPILTVKLAVLGHEFSLLLEE